jgi:phosphatidate cytidylyltransferase|tara:strand:+ start:117 stop:794 length:678 start_codon:yes stop_codon:yes gene_type:complete
MTKNLSKRILTSLVLSIILLICLFLNKYSWLILIIIASTISFFEFNNLVNKIWKKNEILKNSINITCFFYLFFFTYSAYELYKAGLNVTIFILLICIFSDIGGFVIGKTIGGKKLTKISPNKTISGSIGSLIFSLIPIIIFLLIYYFTKNSEFKIHDHEFPTIYYLCLFTSLMCQLGDLFISYYKRKAKIKDTGSILPGHGGLLDRIDGIIFSVPSVIIVYKIFF